MPVNTFRNIEELANVLQKIVCQSSTSVIGLDGKDGVGKTTSAKKLAAILDIPLISLDDYLERNKNQYLQAIRTSDLESAFLKMRGSVLIEGVCLRAVCDASHIPIDISVYVKRMGLSGWHDQDVCDPQDDLETLFEEERRQLRIVTEYFNAAHGENNDPEKADLTEITKEIIRYHAKYRPSATAQYVLENNFA